MMSDQEIIDSFKKIKTWQRGDERAPHKALLILMALGEIQRGNLGFILYELVDGKLRKLLNDFGPPRQSLHPEYPFVRLANDNIWTFNKKESFDSRQDQTPSFLIRNNVSGSFVPNIKNRLIANSKLLQEIAENLLEENFPESIHSDIMDEVGLTLYRATKRRRDPYFRERILTAYEYKCAVCGLSIRLGNQLVGIEAAHIKWHQAGGKDVEQNGIALCSLHHKLFDTGAFTINEEMLFLASDKINGVGTKDVLLGFHGKEINPPQSIDHYPHIANTQWHFKEVFKGIIRNMQ